MLNIIFTYILPHISSTLLVCADNIIIYYITNITVADILTHMPYIIILDKTHI